MKIYLHLGLHKTASTWLQKTVFNSLPDTLLITRPYTIFGKEFSELQFANDIFYDSQRLVDEITRIGENSGKSRIIISDEAFSGLPKYNYLNRSTIANRLSKAFPNAEILLFLRGQAELLESLYKQSIDSGWNISPMDQSFFLATKKFQRLQLLQIR